MSSQFWKTPDDVAELHACHPDIIAASEQTYDRLLNDKLLDDLKRDNIHTEGICYWASELLVDALRNEGYLFHMFFNYSSDEIDYNEHQYAVARSSRGVMVADSTWLQFHADMGTPMDKILEMPKVLVGTRAEVIETAKLSGLPKGITRLWQNKRGHIEKHRTYEVALQSYHERPKEGKPGYTLKEVGDT